MSRTDRGLTAPGPPRGGRAARAARGAAVPLALSVLCVAVSAAVSVPAAGSSATAVPTTQARTAASRPAVIGSRIIGHSVRERPIRAFHLGEPGSRTTVVAIGAMHGDEQQSAAPLFHLRDHRPVTGVDLWVVPVANPDGFRLHDRQNARGVDLNRNYPVRWADLDGDVESGPGPASEPETRAMMHFLTRVDPDHVVSLHQPLYGIDPHTKNPVFARRLAREMRLPIRTVTCGGVCHGTMTQWFNHRHDGDAITAELSAAPSRRYLDAVAPNGLLRTIRGAR
jgi:protein MpaA